MTLNYDCMRDVLISLENNLKLDEDFVFTPVFLEKIYSFEELSKYFKNDIYYCIYNLIDIKFIDGSITFADGGVPYVGFVTNITYSGHEFLQSIKSETIWKKVKSKIKPVAGLSVPLITEVAKELIVLSLKLKK